MWEENNQVINSNISSSAHLDKRRNVVNPTGTEAVVGPPAHQRLVVLDQTHGPGGLLVLWKLVRHRRKDGAVVPLGHRVVS